MALFLILNFSEEWNYWVFFKRAEVYWNYKLPLFTLPYFSDHSLHLGKNGKNLPSALLSETVIQSSSDFSVVTAHVSETPSAETQYSEFSEDTGILKKHWVSLQSSSFFMYILFVVWKEEKKQWKCMTPFNLKRKNHSIWWMLGPCLKIVLISNSKSICYFNMAWCYISIKMFFIEIINLKIKIEIMNLKLK